VPVDVGPDTTDRKRFAVNLFSPTTLGELRLTNRLVMAPLTRTRSGQAGVPGPMVAEHYAQRASLGLIVSEGTYPSHAGRVTHEATTGGHTVVGPSAIAINGQTHTYDGKQPYPVPHALADSELAGVIEEFVTASRNAIAAGLDGVEIHSANGYLLHEFLSPASNQREGLYGGSPANRARFVIEVVTAAADAIGAGRVGLRISPEHNIQDALETDSADVLATYGALVDGLAPLGLAYLSVLHAEPTGAFVQELRARFGGPVLLNSGFAQMTTRDEALGLLREGHAEGVVVGRPAIANPDLAYRWQEDLPLNNPDATTFYGAGPEGYTDYPALVRS